MAKMRIHELAKELGLASKDVLAAALDAGFEVKTASSSVDDDQAESLRRKLSSGGSTPAPEKAEAPKKEEKKEEKKAEEKPAEKPQDKAPAPAPARTEEAKPTEAPKKKKQISIVLNQQNSRMPGRGGTGFQGGRGPAAGPQRGGARGPIKPLTPPSPTPAVQMQQQPIPVKKDQTEQANKLDTPAHIVDNEKQAAPVRPANTDNQNTQTLRPMQGRPQGITRPVRPGGNSQGQVPGGRYNAPGRNSYNDRPNQNSGAQGTRGGFTAPAPGRGGINTGRGGRPNAGQGAPFGNGRGAQPGKAGFTNPQNRDAERQREAAKRKAVEKENKHKGQVFDEDGNVKRRPGSFIKPEKKQEEVVEEVIKVITLPETITIGDLAAKMKLRPADIIKKLFLAGKVVTVNQEISYEDAENIAMEYDILCEKEVKVNMIEELLKEEDENAEDMVTRPPVVCVMGHVDHGKTSLLDAIRNTHVTDRESGGITQAIGAYTVNVKDRSITFLDTPGHEAFTAMRMRGANSTDIAILVVAADDGVMPQTIEAINHAKAAGVEIIVAVNKIDKPSANIDRVKQELSEYELVPEDWGGSTVFAPVSAKTGEGLEGLLEMILLTADVLELKANPNRRARGLVIEAELDKGRGPVATVLVQKGTLHVGDFISAGASSGKVRAMIDDKGRRVKEAGPSTPVEILGLDDVPEAGEVFLAHENDKTAKNFAQTYMAENKEKKLAETQGRMSLEDLFSKIKEGNLKELNLIVKADVQGSVEAVKESLTKLSNDEIIVKCIHGGVGAINESDVNLASASNAIIIGFNVKPVEAAKEKAENENVDVRLYDVIYKAIEDIELAMKGMLDPVFEERIIGHAEVRQIFKASAIGNIAGSYVLDGEIKRGCKVRIKRGEDLVFEGNLGSLKRFKDDVKEVKAGFECGLVFEDFDKMQELDIVEAYVMEQVSR